jgi:ketosteroid isomerase-like protein
LSTSADRAAVLVRAIEAGVAGDSELIDELFTSDVEVWTPALSVSSAAALAVEFEDQEAAFTDVEVSVSPLETGGNQACAEWVAAATFSEPLTVDDDGVIEPTGERLSIRGVAIAEFDGLRICTFRQYWDEAGLLQHLVRLAD